MPRKNGARTAHRSPRNRTGLRNRKRLGVGSYASKKKARRADVYDRPALDSKTTPDLLT